MDIRLRILALAPFPLVALASCDRVSGLRTDAEFKTANPNCVDAAIQMTPGVGIVTHYMNRSESFQIKPYRGKVVTLSHQWLYGPKQTASVQLSYDGQVWRYFNGMMKMGPPWSSDQLNAYAPLMKRLNIVVEQRCDLPIAEQGHKERD